MKKRTVALLCALVMILGVAIGGTMAWLTANTNSVVNTFTTSDVDLELKETTGDEYQMVPGATLEKDPEVTVKVGSVDSYVFVKITEVANGVPDGMTKKPVNYEVAEGWEKVEGANVGENETVYIYTGTVTPGTPISILKDDQVTISDELTKTYMNREDKKPEISFTGYAIQKDYLKVEGKDTLSSLDIWNLASTETTTH